MKRILEPELMEDAAQALARVVDDQQGAVSESHPYLERRPIRAFMVPTLPTLYALDLLRI